MFSLLITTYFWAPGLQEAPRFDKAGRAGKLARLAVIDEEESTRWMTFFKTSGLILIHKFIVSQATSLG